MLPGSLREPKQLKNMRDTILENQPSFRRNSNFSDMSVFLPHRWAVHGKVFSDPNSTHGWLMGGPYMAMHGHPSRDCLNFLHAAWKHAG